MTDTNQQISSGSAPKGGSGLDANVASALSYLCGWVTGLVFLLIDKDSKEVKFHAWQSILISVFSIAYFVVSFILAFIPVIGILIGIINMLVPLALLALVIICMIKAYQGTRLIIPVISDIAEKQSNK